MNLFKKKALLYAVCVICILTIFLTAHELSVRDNQMDKRYPRLIAHAGGDYKGVPMTNSLQALECSVREGFRYIEIDMSTTGDGVVMLVHDWEYAKIMIKTPINNYSPAYKEIMSAKKTHTLIDLNRFIKWLKKHDDVSIITDVKDNNLEILQLLKEKHPGMQHRFIPQIYSFEEYSLVKKMGYENIILTLYKVKKSDEDIISFCNKNQLFALTVSTKRATTEFLKKCSALSLPLYVHTVNDVFEYQVLRKNGVHGVYTDFFQPDSWIEE